MPSYDQFKWAYSIVRSKNVQIADNNRWVGGLIPLYDLIHHEPNEHANFVRVFFLIVSPD